MYMHGFQAPEQPFIGCEEAGNARDTFIKLHKGELPAVVLSGPCPTTVEQAPLYLSTHTAYRLSARACTASSSYIET